jgi:hypothetical protein
MLVKALSLSSILVLSIVSASAAGDMKSANAIMPGCRAFLSSDYSRNDYDAFLKAGLCAGTISGFVYEAAMSKGVLKQALFCPPLATTHEQEVRIVVAYIDKNPAESHKEFEFLALLALTDAWPCKD